GSDKPTRGREWQVLKSPPVFLGGLPFAPSSTRLSHHCGFRLLVLAHVKMKRSFQGDCACLSNCSENQLRNCASTPHPSAKSRFAARSFITRFMPSGVLNLLL